MRKVVDSTEGLLDALAALFPDSSRTTLRQMLRSGRVRVNGEVDGNARRRLRKGDVLDVGKKVTHPFLPPELAILYEDEWIIVILKPAGLLTVATENEREQTVQFFLNQYLKLSGKGDRIHVVHRLDRDTSGVLVFVKDFETRELFKALFSEHAIDREYVAVIEGTMPEKEGTLRSHLREDPDTFHVRSVRNEARGKLAVTKYRTVASGARYSIVEVRLETGRKNQIRVQFSEAGHPVVGDERYGAATDPIARLGLHAQLLGFVHPRTGKKLSFTAPLPDAFRNLEL
ncbi:MAG: RluA family pseudouridine synthase [Thermoanaerobaculia bacterium]